MEITYLYGAESPEIFEGLKVPRLSKGPSEIEVKWFDGLGFSS